VARALGPTNVLTGRVIAVDGRRCRVEVFDGTRTEVANVLERPVGAEVVVSVRPGALQIARPPAGATGVGAVAEALFLGDVVQYVIRVDGREEPVKVVADGRMRFGLGERVVVGIRDGEAAAIEG
jgi:hypothetical protein